MNSDEFAQALVGPPPLAAAASFFVKLKQASVAKENAVIATGCKLASGEKTAQPLTPEEEMAFADQVRQAQQGLGEQLSQSTASQMAERKPAGWPLVASGGALGGLGGAALGRMGGALAGRPGLGTALGAAGGALTGGLVGKGLHGGLVERHEADTGRLQAEAKERAAPAFVQSLLTGQPQDVTLQPARGEELTAGQVGFTPETRNQLLLALLASGISPEQLYAGEMGPAAEKLSSIRGRLDSALKKLAEDGPGLEEYLANEQAGQQIEEQNASGFYRQKLDEAYAQLQAASEQAQSAQQQVMDLQGMQEQSAAQVQAAQQEGQIAQQAALQNVQSANMQSTQALRQALEAENRATMIRQGLLELASAPLGGPTEMQPTPATPETGMGGEGEPMPGQGMGGPGSPMEAAGGQAAPNATPVQGEESATPQAPAESNANQPQQGAEPAGVHDQKPGPGHVSIKVGMKLPTSALVGAGLGAATGAGLAGAEAAKGGPLVGGSLEERRQSIADREAEGSQPGLSGFARAFNLAKDKALLSLGEYTQENPATATIAGGLIGGSVGAGLGPASVGAAKEVKDVIGQIRSHMPQAGETAAQAGRL